MIYNQCVGRMRLAATCRERMAGVVPDGGLGEVGLLGDRAEHRRMGRPLDGPAFVDVWTGWPGACCNLGNGQELWFQK